MALRFQSLQAGPAMQIPVFLILFIAPVYVPLDLISGWVHDAASYNPLTALLECGPRVHLAARPTWSGSPTSRASASSSSASFWALTGLRRAERGV